MTRVACFAHCTSINGKTQLPGMQITLPVTVTESLTLTQWQLDPGSPPGTAAYINYCFIAGHTIWAYVCGIHHSSLLMYWLLCALFQTLIMSKLIRGTFRLPCCCMGGSVSGSPYCHRHLAGRSFTAARKSDRKQSWCHRDLSRGWRFKPFIAFRHIGERFQKCLAILNFV